eukprot:scaffold85033_cov31-Prasinocladus_malaysianus.AAC.1
MDEISSCTVRAPHGPSAEAPLTPHAPSPYRQDPNDTLGLVDAARSLALPTPRTEVSSSFLGGIRPFGSAEAATLFRDASPIDTAAGDDSNEKSSARLMSAMLSS